MFGKMKLLVAGLSLTTLALSAPLAHADDAPPTPPKHKQDGGPRGGDRSKMLTDTLAKLNLTDDQKAKVDPIVTKLKDDMKAIMSDDKLSQDDKRTKGMAAMKAAWTDIEAVLTPDQQAQLKKIRDEQKANHDKGGKKGPGDGGAKGGGDKTPPPAPAN